MGEFTKGLFGCFSDFGTCIITYFIPCFTAGKNAEAVGESCFLYGCLSILGPVGIWSRAKIRGKIRSNKNIEEISSIFILYSFKRFGIIVMDVLQGSFGMDCLVHWFCGLCALCQEARELKGTGSMAQSMVRE